MIRYKKKEKKKEEYYPTLSIHWYRRHIYIYIKRNVNCRCYYI